MASQRPYADYVFHARVQKEASGPTFLYFISPTPPDQAVSAIPTVLKEFGAKEASAPDIKPDPDAELPWPLQLPQPLRPRLSCSALPASSKPLISHRSRESVAAVSSSNRASSVPLQLIHNGGGVVRAGSVARAGSVVHAGSTGPSRVTQADATHSSRRLAIGRAEVADGSPSSASRAATPRAPPRLEDIDNPPALVPTGQITRSLSMRTMQSPKTKVVSSHVDPSLVGITAPQPMDPNDYIRHKRSCQATDEEKGRNRKGKSAPPELVTAWFEYEAEYPLRHPPNLSGHNKIQHGDVFWFRSPYGIQLWLWTEGKDDGEDFWHPASLGVCRNVDGRFLGLNPSQKPSWMTEKWLGKQKKNGGRVFIFKPA